MKTQQRKRKRQRLATRALESLEEKRLMAADLMSVENVDGDVVLTFSEAVEPGPGTGNVTLSNSDGLIEVINIKDGTFDGDKVTLDPIAALPTGTINVAIDSGAVVSGSEVADSNVYFEDFESVELQNSNLIPSLNDYVAVFTGTLDVTVAGEYTFGINSDDGQALAIDVAQDGLDPFDDELIYDNTTHGRQDRLTTCGLESTAQSCVGTGEGAITLDVGEYDFQYFYFERGGGSGGEFFYGPGELEEWDADSFALVGDASKGIGIAGDGITVTVYKEVGENTIGDLPTSEAVITEESLIIGSEVLELADIAENAGGRFDVDNDIPGADEWRAANDSNPFDWSHDGPTGWERDNSDLIEGGADEYNGWTWLSKDFWIAEQGDQNRTRYELAEGTVLVADPDAHDDYINNGSQDAASCLSVLEFGPECGLFTASVDTPEISLSGVTENSATLEFASSWWDEDTQSAESRVEYFNAAGESIGSEVLLRWESISDSDNYKPVTDEDGNDARNELVVVDLNNPADADSMVVTFDMPYATNDWWWAVDNIKVDAEVTGELAEALSGEFVNETEELDGPSVGDFNEDGTVDFEDFLLMSGNFNMEGSPTDGDADESGVVDFNDFLILSGNFNKTVDEIYAEMG